MYSFERDDKYSFSSISRIYNVFENDDKSSPILSLVVGYDSILNKYFVCYWAAESFKTKYDHYPDRSIDTWMEMINEFIVLFEFAFDKTDIFQEGTFSKEKINDMPELTRDNLLYYASSCTYDEIIECPSIIDENDYVIDEAIQKKYLVPIYYESDDDTEMLEYDQDEFLDFIILNEITESMYFTIDFDKINEKSKAYN